MRELQHGHRGEAHPRRLHGDAVSAAVMARRDVLPRCRSVDHQPEVYRNHLGPLRPALPRLGEADGAMQLAELRELFSERNPPAGARSSCRPSTSRRSPPPSDPVSHGDTSRSRR
ncbi:MAG: hypothetical protein K2X91_02800 [Thermoleophilia bacterium]|nr:hypothetical protein [Thermoleophilia bacterium]